jgi:hypothetical protein
MRSDPERNRNPSRCATCSRLMRTYTQPQPLGQHQQSAASPRGPSAQIQTRRRPRLGLQLFLSLRHFPSSAFVSVSIHFLIFFRNIRLQNLHARIPVRSSCREARWLSTKHRLFGFRGVFLPFHRINHPFLSAHSLPFCCVNRCTDVIPGKPTLSLVLHQSLLPSCPSHAANLRSRTGRIVFTFFSFCLF